MVDQVRYLESLQGQSLPCRLALLAEDSWQLPLGKEDRAEQQATADLVGTAVSRAEATAAAVVTPYADGMAATAHEPSLSGATSCQLRLLGGVPSRTIQLKMWDLMVDPTLLQRGSKHDII
ncbi:hypothetical protein MNEG_10915, partial [Monoraphidium neglectum]